ncbi:YraN family protein [Rhodobacteraceae bacterium RKSG542]|uniref:YraN family protein n=1 Tax=Pseudovibrio flavus TaxID=2529854 RepID=UPI0012BD1D71|nr:YraN family protein [Pseudovibrio flavus]MTI18532.1 YraN family protein [Pseudovibrio flavus]
MLNSLTLEMPRTNWHSTLRHTTLARKQAYHKGLMAEQCCAAYLRRNYWRILETRYKAKGGEIDIIARRGACLAFIEVKARKTRDLAIEAISQRNQTRIANAARHWVASNGDALEDFNKLTLRFDAMVLDNALRPEHLPNFFQSDFL